MPFIDLISYNYDIMNTIAKVNTHRYNTIQNNYTIVCQASYVRHLKPLMLITNNKVNKIITFNLKDIKLILHYISLTRYYFKQHIQMLNNHSNINGKIKTI